MRLKFAAQDPSQMAIDPSAIESLNHSVKSWSDFNHLYYHPRSMNQITTHHIDDTIAPFDSYVVGRQSYADNEKVRARSHDFEKAK